MTNRRDCRVEWFLDSLTIQEDELGVTSKIVVVDYFAGERSTDMAEFGQADEWVSPKPTVWQGPSRLTSTDYFAPSNARNTGLCFAEDGLVAFVDDLSVLTPGWLEQALTCTRGTVLLGAYAKVKNLNVVNGEIMSYEPFEGGVDSRARFAKEKTKVTGGWMFGCSVVGHIDDFLTINGFDEDCDSMGGEDYCCGLMLEQNGVGLYYVPEMKTLESEELHHVEPPFKRIIKPHGPSSTFKDKDASHAMLRMVEKGGRRRAPNYCNLRELRAFILGGGGFPDCGVPEHDWRDGQPLREM